VTDGAPMPRALTPPARWIGSLGHLTFYIVESLGRFGRFLAMPWPSPHTAAQLGRLAGRIYFIGFKSLTIVILTGAFTGMALGLQVFLTCSAWAPRPSWEPPWASLVRELGPVLTAVLSPAWLAPPSPRSSVSCASPSRSTALMVHGPQPHALIWSCRHARRSHHLPHVDGHLRRGRIYEATSSPSSARDVPGTTSASMQAFADMTDVMVGFWKSLTFGVLVPVVCTYKGFHCGHARRACRARHTEAVCSPRADPHLQLFPGLGPP